MPNETITLGGGCFWCLEEAFRHLPGVISVESGYAGGYTENPDYREVCSGNTGHAEVVQIKFNPDEVSLDKIFDLYWHIHDPTTLNRQGSDIGTQYRSIILYANSTQKACAKASIHQLNNSKRYDDACTTELTPLHTFFPAEEYHQKYFQKNPNAGYCQAVIAPKLAKLKKLSF